MHGFKSFANKEVMKLGQGITTVVGPNGCGKTNIVDAIRWVLGEQKYSILRSGKMEDVIFNGAENTKPLGVCEVSMTVHNNEGKLPIEYNDIEIARRVYRNGESEYYLNKTQCRLKDIMDLFVDTGMGADAYSVIELKMIEQILSETTDDRRKMFEEAAGIHKYRTQKKTTLRKFEATRNDLERVQDIIAEVEQKVRGLELQLKRFKRHASLTESLESKDIELAFIQVHRFKSHLVPLHSRIIEYQHLRESKSDKNSIHEKELIQLKKDYKNQEEEVKQLQAHMNEINEKRESLRNNILVYSEQGRGSIQTIERLEREKSNNFKKIESLKQLSLDFDKELTELEPAIEQHLNNYQIKREKFVKINEEYQQTVKKLDQLQNERWEYQRKISDDRSIYDRTKTLIKQQSDDINKVNEEISHLNDNKNRRIIVLDNIKQDEKNVSKDLSKFEKGLITYNSRMKELEKQLGLTLEEKHKVTALINSLNGQKEFYSELLESKDGFPDGTKFILENPKSFPGVLGTVADMFQVDDKYRDSLECALGDLSHCLIAKDRVSAISSLKKANQLKVGDLTIIPLKEASNFKINRKELPVGVDGIKRASEIINTNKKVRPLVDYLLGNLLIVDELITFTELNIINEWNIVDLNGNYSGNDLVLKNRQVSEHGNLLGRQKKLNVIKHELNILISDEKKQKKKFADLSNSIKKYKIKIDEILNKIKEVRQSLTDLEKEYIRNQVLFQQLTEKIKSKKQDSKNTKIDLKQAKKALALLKPAIEKADKNLTSFEKRINQSNDTVLIARNNRDDYQQKLQDSRIKLIELESRRDQLKFRKTSGNETSEELKNRQESILNEICELKEKKKYLDDDITSSEKKLDSINAEIQKQRSIIDLKQSVFRETYQNMEEIQLRISNEQQDREQILEDLKNTEIEATETEQKIQLINERISDRYNIEIPENLVVDQSEEQLELEIAKMHKSLENIGPVNMAVQDEYNDEIKRFELLSTQRDDLFEAEKNLLETIRKIDTVARKRFQEAFDLIKSNFEKLFNLFFDGGDATLKLVGDPDPLEADIAIDAHPPGKRNATLRLLSSGEKALTAISLLFAIYQVKPSPYCILDEVDAPLDDVNIHKFTRVLAKFCDETQFIIVTHNKLTMEIADYMYGVTQEKKGISKLVSVKFD